MGRDHCVLDEIDEEAGRILIVARPSFLLEAPSAAPDNLLHHLPASARYPSELLNNCTHLTFPALVIYGAILMGIGLLMPQGILNFARQRPRPPGTA